MFRLHSPECAACVHGSDCSDAVRAIQPEAMEVVIGLANLLGSSRTVETAKWWKGLWTSNKRAQRSQERVSSVLERWNASGVNPYLLKHRLNPIQNDDDSISQDMFKFMIDERAFKPRDVVEHLRDSYPQASKASLEKHVKQACEALLSIQVLKKEGHVFCL